MMDRRFVTVMVVSLLFALIVSAVFFQMTRGSGGGKVSSSSQKDLVVATKALGIGAIVKTEDLKVVKVAESAFPKGAFSKVEEVVDRPVISNVLLDEPILEGRLAAKGAGLGLAPVIPDGMRAVTVRVTDVVGVAGFVQPGLRVDVLVTGRAPNQQATTTATVLQNIQVLSAGTTLAPDARGQAINAPTVTLLVTPEQAEVLTLSASEGRIQLVLRNGRDNTVKPTPGSNLNQLYGKGGTAGPSDDVPVSAYADNPEARRPKRVAVARETPPPAIPKLVPSPLPPQPEQIVVIRGAAKTLETVLPARTSRSPFGVSEQMAMENSEAKP